MINEIKQIKCTCGRKANMYKFTHYGIYFIVCECGKRTGADTEERATELWRNGGEA